ncbi:hypothetical protein K474DRAFT_1709684 [Panus rudis PR-1116 ss-1]|nr:hypothetical protein K474DRAFT_1709684 [Panus rudis PR-1116 ss-1]
MTRSSPPHEASPSLAISKHSPPHRTPSQAPSLNMDEILYMARILETKDLLHLIQTCRALYVAGIPLLARHIKLRLDFYIEADRPVADIFSSFCSFFEADHGRRCRYLQVLDIIPTYHHDHRKKLLRPRGLSENLVRLARILQQCSNMRYLALRDRTAEEFVQVPDLLEALGSLHSLRQVSVYQEVDPSFVYSDAIPVLQSIVSPVTSVYLDDGRYNDHDNKDIEYRSSVVKAFGHLSSTLEILRAAHPAFDDEDCDSLIFPKLTNFTTAHSILGDLVTSRFMRMFPRLQVLNFGALSQEDSEDILLHDSDSHAHDEMRSIRERNKESQKEDRWATLDVVNADILTLYALALVGPIRHVELLGILQSDNLHLDMWSAILRDSLASTVTIRVNTQCFDLGVLPSIAPRNHPLTHLDLTIVFDSERGDRDRRMFWVRLHLYGIKHSSGS